jgi:hypothetical protein
MLLIGCDWSLSHAAENPFPADLRAVSAVLPIETDVVVVRYEGREGPRQDRGATVQGLRDSIGEGTTLTRGPNGHIESLP